MLNHWFIFSLLAGFGVATVAGALGCFVVWRKMSYFGDTLAHSSLLGISLGMVLNINLNFSILLCVICISIGLVYLQNRQNISSDTLLGILAHSSLAIGLVIISFSNKARLDMAAYLFGDVLVIDRYDLYWIYGCCILVLSLMIKFWKQFLSITIHKELAFVEGLRVKCYEILLTLMIACVIAIGMKIVGVLLITSLMIIPAATAKKFSQTPIQMLFISILVAICSVLFGTMSSWFFDTPGSPSIVVTCFLFFILSRLMYYLINNRCNYKTK